MIILLLYTVFCIWLAHRDANKIHLDVRPDHDNNGIYHAMCFSVVLFSCFITKAWLALVIFFPLGKLVFDTALNLFRKKDWDYVSPDAKQPQPVEGASKFDWAEYQVFKSGAWPKVAYVAIILTLIIIHYGT